MTGHPGGERRDESRHYVDIRPCGSAKTKEKWLFPCLGARLSL